MSGFESMTIREVESSDLETFYQHQLDPEAIRMAAFVHKDPKDKVAFDAHWDKILNSSQNTNRTIVAEGQVAGHIACYPDGEHMEVTYWLGREFWGRGLATEALTRMLHLVVERPIFARAATDNIGSIRGGNAVLKSFGKNKGFANGRGEETEEYILRLDRDYANESAQPADRDNARELTLVRTVRLRSAFFLNSGREHARPRVSHLYR
jgi:hypothetical protein